MNTSIDCLHLCVAVIAALSSACATAAPHQADVERRVSGRAGPQAFAGNAERLGAEMSVDDAVAVALANNQALQARFREVDAAFGGIVDARAIENPELELETKIPVGDAEGSTAIEGALLQELNTFLIRGPGSRAAKMELEQAKVRATSAVLELGARAREAVWQYIAARELAELRETVVKATDASYEVAVRLFEAGNLSRLEVAQRKAAREQARLDLRRAELALDSAREELNRVMGLYGEQAASWEITAELPEVPAAEELPLGELESIAVGSSLALEGDRFGLDAAATRGRAAAWGAWPGLAVGVFAEYEFEEGFTAVGPAIALTLPIWSFGRGRILAARGNLEAAQAQYAQAAIDLRSNVREAREMLAEAADRARFLRDVLLPLRREITEQTLLRYNAMHAGVFELLLAKQAEIEALTQWVEATRDYWVARTRVDLIVQGGPAFRDSGPQAGRAGVRSSTETMNGGH